MITIQEQNTKKKKSNFLKSNLKNYLVDKNQIAEFSKPLWFKGSRYR